MTPTEPDYELSADALARLDQAIATIHSVLGPLIGLTAEDARGQQCELGMGTEIFCRQMMLVLQQNRDALNLDFDLDEVQWALRTYDALQLRLLRLQEVLAGAQGCAAVLGEDLLLASVEGYAELSFIGRHKSLEALHEACFGRAPRKG